MTLIARIALALLAAALFPAAARAETFTVTTGTDGNAPCTAISCTLRSALAAAASNGTAVDDTIVLKADTYVLSAQLGSLSVPANQTRIFIRGAGANTTFIQPQTGAAIRVLVVNGGAQVTLSGLALRNGSVTSGMGGNLWQLGDSSVTLERVRVSGGRAPQGGGIATGGGGSTTTLAIRQSLIDGNSATGTTANAAGGGLYIAGATASAAVTVTDSTIYGNSAVNGAGVAVTFNAAIPPALRGVTLVGNVARANVDGPPGAGGISSTSAKVNFQGSIVAGNLTTFNFSTGQATVPANCAIANGATDEGGNVTPDSDCGLGGSHADPQLIAPLDETEEPPVLALPATSPAVDVAACGGRTVDQRGVARPQLTACDAGAYEYQPPPSPPPPPPPPTPTPTPTATATATPTPTATPVRNKSVGAQPVRGTVLIKRPGTSKFVPLEPSVIGNGSEVDARKGRVQITTSTNEKATFYDGIFKVSQSRGLTTLTLTEKLDCSARGKARAAAKKPKTRKLWGDGKGRFRTKGTYSAATVRGTRWLVRDGCRYTRTTVAVGSVNVRDEVKKKAILLRKGKRYTARPKR